MVSVWKGTIVVGEGQLPNPTFHTLVLSAEEGQTGVKLTAGEEGAEFVLVSQSMTMDDGICSTTT
jgi:hypothetical protein